MCRLAVNYFLKEMGIAKALLQTHNPFLKPLEGRTAPQFIDIDQLNDFFRIFPVFVFSTFVGRKNPTKISFRISVPFWM